MSIIFSHGVTQIFKENCVVCEIGDKNLFCKASPQKRERQNLFQAYMAAFVVGFVKRLQHT